MDVKKYRLTKGNFKVKDFETNESGHFKSKEDAVAHTAANLLKIGKYQDKLYAEGKNGLLIIFQAMDAAGKDGAVKHVFSSVNPQGVNVYSFKQPSVDEAAHDYMWRAMKNAPKRGSISIFNRSYYEDVLIAKVHKLYESQSLPKRCQDGKVIERRYKEIANFEKYLYDNGITIVKFFLNISKEEQKRRFLSRIEDETKNWKFSKSDMAERKYWDDYMDAYEKAINETATPYAPWYIIPGDKKWYARSVIAQVIADTLNEIDPKYPELAEEAKADLAACRVQLDKA